MNIAFNWSRKLTSIATIAAVLTLSMSSLFAVPNVAQAATNIFTENFGTGSTGSISGWTDGGVSGTDSEARASGSGNDSASSDGGRFAYIYGDTGWICRTITTTSYTNVNLSYYWRGDSDSESSDHGVVEFKSASGHNCSDSTGWTQLQSHNMDTDSSWSSQSAFHNAGFDGTSFLLRFRDDSSQSDEGFRVDGISVVGDSTADTTAPSGGSISYTNGYTNSTTASITFSTGTDSGSGLNLSTGKIQRSVGTFSLGSCSGYGSFTNLVTTTSSPYSDTTLSSGHCYKYQYVISDNSGNTATYTSANEVKVDTAAPTIIVPSDFSVEATGPLGAVVSFVYGISDALSGVAGLPTCTPASGSTFAIATTPVSCSGQDNAGNTGNAAFNVTVQDTTAPSITIPGPNPLNLNVGDTFTEPVATASDLVDGSVTPTVDSDNVDTAHHHSYSVVYKAVDAHGNPATATLTVNVSDITAPVVTVPANITAEATDSSGAAVNFTVTANDNDDGALTPSCDYNSGDTFPLGTTTVHCSATDTSSLTGNASFTITVEDTTHPEVTPAGDITVHASGLLGAIVTFGDPAVTDAVDGTDSVSCSPSSGSLFAIGTTTVNCESTDSHGNTGYGSFDVGVYNNAPVLDAISDQSIALSGQVDLFAHATDADSDPITYSLDTLPSGLSIAPTIDPSTGEFTWNSNGTGPATKTFTVIASDGMNDVSTSFTVVVSENPAPSSGGGAGGNGGNGPFSGISGGPGPSAPGLVLGASTSTVPENTGDNGDTGSTTPATGEVLGATTFSECSADKHLITSNLGIKRSNNPVDQVNLLDKFLNTNLNLNLSTGGVFTADVESAVKTFQGQHVADVLTPWGITDPTGFVGPTTRRMIDILACGADYPIPTDLH